VLVPPRIEDDTVDIFFGNTVWLDRVTGHKITTVHPDSLQHKSVKRKRVKRFAIRFRVGRRVDVSARVAAAFDCSDTTPVRLERCGRHNVDRWITWKCLHSVAE
jgi:hypothetical protein